MSKKTKIKIPAKFAFLIDGAYIPAEMWKSLAAFTAHPKRDVRYYLCGFHLDRAMCAWQATNGHVAVSCKLSPAIQSDPYDPATLPPDPWQASTPPQVKRNQPCKPTISLT